MKDVLLTIFGGFLFSVVIIYIVSKGGGNRIDPNKLEQIRKDINNKPLAVVINEVNDWLS